MHSSQPEVTARRNGLAYVTYSTPGISRVRRGASWSYLSPRGTVIRSPAVLSRLKSLAIPPAWKKVWICPSSRGHLQATGFDAAGRRQYQYHPKWTASRNVAKFDSLPQFAASLPALRARVAHDLRHDGLSRDKVAACIVYLMDRTLIRIGNAEYARDNSSYGLTTALNRHARVSGQTIHFKFKAKSGRMCDTSIDSPRAARIVRKCQDLPGQELFCYQDESGRTRDIGSADVNAYLSQCCKGSFTAKDFRTWGGTCAALNALCTFDPPGPDAGDTTLARAVTASIGAAAETLGNTVAVCRKFYIHPAVIDAFASGDLHRLYARAARARVPRMSRSERTLLLLLKDPARRIRVHPGRPQRPKNR
jgi:DNA topoisomerase I